MGYENMFVRKYSTKINIDNSNIYILPLYKFVKVKEWNKKFKGDGKAMSEDEIASIGAQLLEVSATS